MQSDENYDIKPMNIRIKHPKWTVKKYAYQQIQNHLLLVKSSKQQFKINDQIFNASKITSILNNLVEQKHPNVLMKGLQCVQKVLKIDQTLIKSFNKLLIQGLQKFPLITQQRNIVLQKFMDIIEYFKTDINLPHVLTNRLALANQKSVMFVIEVIGVLKIHSLKDKLLQIGKTNRKKDIKELANQIAQQLQTIQQQHTNIAQSIIKKKIPTKIKKEQEPNKKIIQLIDKLPQYQSLNTKDKQKYSQELTDSIQSVLTINSNNLASLSYYIQLMIQDNNQIISMNSIKILAVLIKNKSPYLPTSFPLFFILRKFKMHKTHANNAALLKLIQQLFCSNRSLDICNAIIQGMNSQQNKANLKFGSYLSYIKLFSHLYRDQQLYQGYCIGEYIDIYQKIQNKKALQKIIYKGYQILSKQKDKQYNLAIQKIKSQLSLNTIQANKSKQTIKQTKHTSIKQINKLSTSKLLGNKKPSLNNLQSPEGQFNKIKQIIENQNIQLANLKKSIQKCLKIASQSLGQQMFDLFYFCEIADTFISQYQSREQYDETISIFLIDYLKIISSVQINQIKKKSKIVLNGIQYLIKISVCSLSLSKQLLFILDNLLIQIGIQVILNCCYNIIVNEKQRCKKKNKKYLIKWLQRNIPQHLINHKYYQLREYIQNQVEVKQKYIEKQPIKQPIKNPTLKERLNQKLLKTKQLKQQQITQQSTKQQLTKQQTFKLQQLKQLSIKQQKNISFKVQQQKKILNLTPNKNISFFQNADISKIQRIQDNQDKIDQKWQYFLNKKNNNLQLNPSIIHNYNTGKQQTIQVEQQQKYNAPQQQQQQQQKSYYKQQQYQQQHDNHQYKQKLNNQSQQNNEEHQQQNQDQQQQIQNNQIQEYKFKFIKKEQIQYMLHNSTTPFNHLKTNILLPFKRQNNKSQFLKQLTFLIKQQKINKPQPYKSLLLLVILLFTQIKTDKSIIQHLQYLYEYMAQLSNNNQFLKILIGLYHSVIDQSEQNDRKLLLNILTKSMVRIMPHVQNSLQLMKDFQQFYQIGEMVYFQMFPEQYSMIKNAIQKTQNIQYLVKQTYSQQGQGLISIIQGWLETDFKKKIKQILQLNAFQ